eukprot:1140853-Pelagomonas_calceolata.AAC.8
MTCAYTRTGAWKRLRQSKISTIMTCMQGFRHCTSNYVLHTRRGSEITLATQAPATGSQLGATARAEFEHNTVHLIVQSTKTPWGMLRLHGGTRISKDSSWGRYRHMSALLFPLWYLCTGVGQALSDKRLSLASGA